MWAHLQRRTGIFTETPVYENHGCTDSHEVLRVSLMAIYGEGNVLGRCVPTLSTGTIASNRKRRQVGKALDSGSSCGFEFQVEQRSCAPFFLAVDSVSSLWNQTPNRGLACHMPTLVKDRAVAQKRCPWNKKYVKKYPRISCLEHKINDWVRIGLSISWAHRNLVRQLSTDRNWRGSAMSRATTASPKPFLRALWRVGDAVVGKEMLDGRHQRVDVPADAGTAHDGFPKERLEEDLFCRPSCSPDDPVGQRIELD